MVVRAARKNHALGPFTTLWIWAQWAREHATQSGSTSRFSKARVGHTGNHTTLDADGRVWLYPDTLTVLNTSS